MMKKLFTLIAGLLCFHASFSQFRYVFKDTNALYVPISGGTLLSGNTPWKNEIFTAPLPFTWVVDSSLNVPYFNLYPFRALTDTNDYTHTNGFVFADILSDDRASIGGSAALSPIVYLTTGTAPDRIFKIQMANAGFREEIARYHTADDYFNLQVWVYEKSNIVELHYGPSRISHPADYFYMGKTGPNIAYSRDANLRGATYGKYYYLRGSAGAPSIDSFNLNTLPGDRLDAWPSNGQVYRFTPTWKQKPNAVPEANHPITVEIYPTAATGALQVRYHSQEPAQYRITSVSGQVVNTGRLCAGLNNLNIHDLSAGNYIINVTTASGNSYYRFVKL